MKLLEYLTDVWKSSSSPFLIQKGKSYYFQDILSQEPDLSKIKQGSVVAIIGDYNISTIAYLLFLIEQKAIILPLTMGSNDQDYFLKEACVEFIIQDDKIIELKQSVKNELIEDLKEAEHAGLILFSTGTTGKPKAILHDLTKLLEKFFIKRPPLRTLNFLLFDHIGGLNTLLHTLFNKGVIVVPNQRSITEIFTLIKQHDVELLPTTPTFLRLMLLSGRIPSIIPPSLKLITYGTERMDESTLTTLCDLLPSIIFKQTYGMSELGILSVRSKDRRSLFLEIGGNGVKTKVLDNILYIYSPNRMLGYLNAPDPFVDGWYNTNDLVEQDGNYYKILGRCDSVINAGGLKFLTTEIEDVVISHPLVAYAKVTKGLNPITGEHAELLVELKQGENLNKSDLSLFLKQKLPPHMIPPKITFDNVPISERFKKL